MPSCGEVRGKGNFFACRQSHISRMVKSPQYRQFTSKFVRNNFINQEVNLANNADLIPAIFEGWNTYQNLLVEALRPLNEDQLALRTSPKLRSIGQIAANMIGARARWFYLLMGEGGERFKALGKIDRRGAPDRSAEELVQGLEDTWQGMKAAMDRWSAEDWARTWPGEDETEPEMITRQWVIWHLIEHDLHHGGEISLTLGANGIKAPDL